MPSSGQNRQSQPISRRRQRRNDWMIHSFLFVLLSCSCLLRPTNAFSQPNNWQMAAYKPPVKSSVSKIRSPRWSSGNVNNNTGGGIADKQSQSESSSRQPSKQRASAAASLPTEGASRRSSSPPSFQERMRGVLNEESERARIATRKKQSMPQNVFEVETLQAYQELVASNNKLVVVRFYAPWCRACKAIQPIFYKMAHQFPNVVFVDVPCHAKNANLHQGLGVPSLPYGHIYHPTSGLVEETKLSRKQFPQLARKLQAYVQGRCDLLEVGDVSCPYLPVVVDDATGTTSTTEGEPTNPIAP